GCQESRRLLQAPQFEIFARPGESALHPGRSAPTRALRSTQPRASTRPARPSAPSSFSPRKPAPKRVGLRRPLRSRINWLTENHHRRERASPWSEESRRPSGSLCFDRSVCDQVAHLFDHFAIVALAEDSRARYEHVGTRCFHLGNIVEFHPAIDLNIDLEGAPIQLAAHHPQFFQRLRNKFLSSETGMNAHDENHVEVRGKGQHAL